MNRRVGYAPCVTPHQTDGSGSEMGGDDRWGVSLILLALLTATLVGCGGHGGTATGPDSGAFSLSRDAMLDPESCQGCHPSHYADWSQSMHAYAADDPVFVAMNQRGQRETNGQLGNFCVTCHAPMAVRDSLTTDGLNLASLPQKYKGVTCFYCHSIASVDGSHNAELALSSDLAMRGEYSSTVPNPAHATTYSAMHDRDQLDSARACGACHDIVVHDTNAFIERTSCEWSHSAFNAPSAQGGQTCAQCHMVESNGAIAQGANLPVRKYHRHDFPGVDIALGATDAGAAGQASVKQFLASSLQGGLCVTQAGGIRAIIDPVFLGHDWPSGAAQDRRAWAEVIAYRGGNVIYQSGVVPDGTPAVALQVDPDLWLLRDQMYDGQGNPVDMFWQAASTKANAIPALATFNPLDPRYYQTHVEQFYPRTGMSPGALPQMPDRVTFRMRLQPVGTDVLESLVTSGDLDPNVVGQMPTFDVSFFAADGSVQPALEWTPAAASLQYVDEYDQTLATCVATSGFNVGATKVPAPAPAALAECSSPDENDGGAPSAIDAAGDAQEVGAMAGDTGVAPDAAAACDPKYNPDPIEAGLTKVGSVGAFTFVLVHADPVPPGVDYNTWIVKVLDQNGAPVPNASFPQIKTWMPLHGHPSSIVPTSASNGDGTYTIKLYLFMPGLWQITPTVQVGSTTDQAVFTFCVGG